MRKMILTCLVILTLGLTGCSDDDDPVGPASGRTLRVPAQFEKIQQAIDAAVPGDVVLVAPGTYTDTVEAENLIGGTLLVCIDLKSGVEVRGDSDQTGDVILRGNPVNPVVNCLDVDAATILTGFTITGGRTGVSGGRAQVKIVNCVIEENHSLSQFGAGGGMYWDFSSPTVTNCVFAGNSAPFGGGAVFANDSHPVLTNCVFSGNRAWTSPNTAGTGGALVVSNDCTALFTNCLFSGNQADSLGGAIEVHQSEIEMVNCTITGNHSGGMGGAVFVDYLGRVELTNGLIENNSAVIEGGGFYFRGDSPSMYGLNSRIRSNVAPAGPDGFLRGPYVTPDVIFRCCDVDEDGWVGPIVLDDQDCD